ncbi:sortase [Erysipelotrichaceae bacterium OttesenSCG-928-M19]|nr:sortase [Erysipelotrichaceae bacterium OttesenSCG-928-M19]
MFKFNIIHKKLALLLMSLILVNILLLDNNSVNIIQLNKATLKDAKKIKKDSVSMLGYIKIAGVLKKSPIVKGSSKNALALGVGLMEHSVLPNEKGQTILTGHRETLFKDLVFFDQKDIRQIKDKVIEVYLKDLKKVNKYQITKVFIVNENSASKVWQTALKKNQLVLITCYPFTNELPDRRFIIYADKLTN